MRQIPKSVSGTAKKLHGSSKPMKGRFVLRLCAYFIRFGMLYFFQIIDIDFVLLKEIV